MRKLPSRRWVMMLVLISIIAMLAAPPLFAHGGGTPRLTNVPVGPYHLYAWSEPEPWRVGQVHLSLAVTKPNPESNSNQIEIPVTDVEIIVTYTPIDDNDDIGGANPSEPIVVQAVRQEFLSDFYYEADPTLTRVGDWQITVDVSGPDGSGSTQFAMETLPERTLNWTLIASAGAVVVVILALIALWSRSQKPAQPTRRPHSRSHSGVRRGQKSRAPKSRSQRAIRKEA